MATIQVDQAVFTSAKSSHIRGYHLVGRSKGVSEPVAQVLCQWSPSHQGLVENELSGCSLNFFRIDTRRFAVSRTVLGGPEYSGRGGLQTVTMILIVTEAHLEGFDCDPVTLVRMALSMGQLIFAPPFRATLPTVELPDHCLMTRCLGEEGADQEVVRQVMEILAQGRNAAIVGLHDPIPTLWEIIDRTPRNERKELSFCTGLKPSAQRLFRLQFLSSADLKMRSQLSSERITLVMVPERQSA